MTVMERIKPCDGLCGRMLSNTDPDFEPVAWIEETDNGTAYYCRFCVGQLPPREDTE